MWRIGVLFIALLLQLTSADVKTGVNNELVHRLRRSPQYYNDCGPPPPPPPPPFWPPPPPPPFWRHPHPPPWGPPPPPPTPQYQTYSQAKTESVANAASNAGANVNPGGNVGANYIQPEPCTTCGNKGSNAVSNAQSETGQAVAVAIARASAN